MRHPYRHIEDPTMHLAAVLVAATCVVTVFLVLLVAPGFQESRARTG